MIIVLTGQPRHGKSQYSIKLLLDLIKENRKREEQGKLARDIYCNIAGVNDPDVKTKLPEVMNQDIVFKDKKLWFGEHKDCPDGYVCPSAGSVFIYDECHKVDWIKETSGTLSNNPTCISMNEHGHEDYIFILITQFPQYIHTHLRGLVEYHYHSKRSYGAKRSKIYKWNEFQLTPRADKALKDAYEKESFKFSDKYQNCYKSASAHDSMKINIPMPVFYLLGALIFFFGFAYHQYTKSPMLQANADITANKANTEKSTVVNNTETKKDNEEEQQDKEQIKDDHETKIVQRRIYLIANNLPKDYEIRRVEPMLQVRGVVQMKGKCLAYNAYGDVMTLTQSECKEYVNTGRVYRSESSNQPMMTTRAEPFTPSEPRPQNPQETQQPISTSKDEYLFTDKSQTEYIFN